jgi:hypothetical protein
MKNTWLMLAVLLAGIGAACRAEDAKSETPQPGESKAVILADGKDTPADAPRDAGKDYVEPVDARAMPAAASCGEKKSGLVCPAPPGCYCGRGSDCCHRLWAWLTYRPLKKPCLTDCCHKCNGCWVPPLYLYFLDQYHACASTPGCTTYPAYGCASGCAGCTHR